MMYEIITGVLVGAVVYLIISIEILKKELKDTTSLYAEDDGVGGKIIRNGRGEITLEL